MIGKNYTSVWKKIKLDASLRLHEYITVNIESFNVYIKILKIVEHVR